MKSKLARRQVVIIKTWLDQPVYHVRDSERPWFTHCGLRVLAYHVYLPWRHARKFSTLCKNCERSL